jgi:hypothetical protein
MNLAQQTAPGNVVGNPLAALGINVTPQPSGYPGADMPKIDFSQIDTESVPKDLHSNALFARKLTQAILDSIRTCGTWYIGGAGLPVVHWDSLSYRFLTYDFPVSTIAENPENGAIPLVERSVRKYKGDVERFAIGARFSLPEMQNMDASDQGVNIIKLVTQQLRAHALETLGSAVMRTFVSAENFFRRQGRLENYFAKWTIEDYYAFRKITHGSAARGEGGFRIMLDRISDERQKMHLLQLDTLAVHRATRAMLTQDNREEFIGGSGGVARFEAGVNAMDTFHKYTLNVADTFRRTERAAPENVLERLSINGEFYLSTAPGSENQPHGDGWNGFSIYDEQRDVKHHLQFEALKKNLCWWDKDGKWDIQTLKRVRDEWNEQRVMARRVPEGFHVAVGDLASENDGEAFDVEFSPHPALRIDRSQSGGSLCRIILNGWVDKNDEELDGYDGLVRLDGDSWVEGVGRDLIVRDVSKYWIRRDNVVYRRQAPHEGPVQFAAHRAVAAALVGRVVAAQNGIGASKFVRVDTDASTAAVEHAQALFDDVDVDNMIVDVSSQKMFGVASALQGAKIGASTFFTKNNGVYVAAVQDSKEARELAALHGFVEIPVGVDPAQIRRTEAGVAVASAAVDVGTIGTAKSTAAKGKSAASVQCTDEVFDKVHMAQLAGGEMAQYVRAVMRHIGALSGNPLPGLPGLNRRIRIGMSAKNWPFHFMVIRDNISRTMASAIAYGKEPGNVMMSQMKSMSSGNTSDMHGYISYEFNMGTLIHTPEKVMMLEDVSYLRYNGGKNCEFARLGPGSEVHAWVDDSSQKRGDMIVHAIPIGTAAQLQYASLSGDFETNGYPIGDTMRHNNGYFPGQQFVYHRMNLSQAHAGRTPETEYTVPAQVNFNLALGTAWSPHNAEGGGDVLLSSGANTLDGGDYLGAKEVRLGRGFTHERLLRMQSRGAGRL